MFLSIPADVLQAEGEIDLGRPSRVAPRLRGDAEAIAAAARLLAAAERPGVLAGDGVARGGATAELVALAELLGAPVHLEGMDNAAPFPSSHPLFRGPIGRLAPRVRKTLAQYDVLVSAGGDLLTLSLPSDIDPVPASLRIIHLDTDAWQLGKSYPAEVAILADLKAGLAELTSSLSELMPPSKREQARRRGDSIRAAIAAERESLCAEAREQADSLPIKPLALWQAIGPILPQGIVIVDETISASAGLRQFLAADDACSFFGMRGGGIGWGLPAAIGIQLALPDRRVLALIGDGSALYNCQALWTAAHERLAIAFLILNNGSYRILKQRLHALRGHAAQVGRYVGMDLMDPPIDFVGLARSFGLRAERVDKLPDVSRALSAALAAPEPSLIEVATDPAFGPV